MPILFYTTDVAAEKTMGEIVAEAVDQQQLQVRFRSAMPIAGAARAKHDTVRLTLDVDVQLVQMSSSPLAPPDGVEHHAFPQVTA